MADILSQVLAQQLLRLQMGKETAWGTAVPATALLMGATPTPKITPNTKETVFPHQLGTLEPAFVHAKLQSGGAFSIPGTLTYEEAPILLTMGLGTTTPAGAVTKTITANSMADPTEITTSTSHGLLTGDIVTISGSNSTPSIDGIWPITKTAANKFTIDVNVTIAGTAGSVAYPYVWTFEPSLTAVPAVLPYTLELGNMGDGSNLDDVSLSGCLSETLKLHGEIGKEVTFEVAGFGKTFATGVQLTGAIGYKNPIPEPVLFLGTGFWMDPAGTTIATTPFNAALAKFDLEITTGMSPVYTAESRTPTAWTHKAVDAKLNLTLLLNNALREFLTTNLIIDSSGTNQVPVLVRIKAVSGAKVVQIDYSGVMTADPALFEAEQEVQALSVSLSALYDAVMSNHLSVSVNNSLASLP